MSKFAADFLKPKKVSSVQIIVFSFLIIITVGAILLSLPIASSSGKSTPFSDSLFTATSATCVTGLSVYDTASHWSLFGQIVILVLIQLGALGFVTLFTFFTLTIKSRLGLRDLQLVKESVGANGLEGMVKILRITVGVTFLCEFIGALLLMTSFVPEFGKRGIYISFFMAISAYCNAGFDILGADKMSLSTYNGDPVVIFTICALTVVGGLGFIAIGDIYNRIFKKTKRNKLSIHTKIVLCSAAALIIIGTVLFLIFEWDNTLVPLKPHEKLLAALLQSVCARTSGFYSVNLKAMHSYTKFIYIMLMFIGAAPGSTAGGVKTTVIVVVIMTVVCVMRGYDDTIVGNRKISHNVVYKSLSIIILGIFIVTIVTFTIIMGMGDENVSAIDALFEAASAFGTTGSSCNLTSRLSFIPKIAVIIAMFIGRVGPVSLSLAISKSKISKTTDTIMSEANIIVG